MLLNHTEEAGRVVRWFEILCSFVDSEHRLVKLPLKDMLIRHGDLYPD
jgi:hypothetical protein